MKYIKLMLLLLTVLALAGCSVRPEGTPEAPETTPAWPPLLRMDG